MLIEPQHNFNFASLVQVISNVQEMMQAQAAHAVNLSLTSRNWLIGMYIVEYEQHGQDRAQYGDKLLKNLAAQLRTRGLGERRLYEFRQLYMAYPQFFAKHPRLHLRISFRPGLCHHNTKKMLQINSVSITFLIHLCYVFLTCDNACF